MRRDTLSDVTWVVRVDAQPEPVLEVLAPHWYLARQQAASTLGVEPRRLFVSQKRNTQGGIAR